MKGIYVITIAFLASWSVCTANEEQQSTQEIELQDDYYRDCPYPDPNSPNTTTNIPHESDCTKFYKCILGEKIEQNCPLMWKDDPKEKRLHFNRALQVCDWPWEAGCHLCPKKDEDGNYPPESRIQDSESDNCRDYIICKKGKGTKKKCGTNECFSRRCQDCVLKKNLKKKCNGASDSGLGSSSDKSSPKPPDDECDYREPHECNCSLYYEENEDGDKIREECEGGLRFDFDTCTCMEADEANCPYRKNKKPNDYLRTLFP